MKRLIVCCDGTWQNLTSEYPTNVVKIAQAIKPNADDGTAQLVFYTEGVGSGKFAEKLLARVDRIMGGAFGVGIDYNIQDAYRFLSLNYAEKDEIYLFGFSRGAYTVRSLAGLINCWGGLLPLANIREAPLVYELYRDRNLTVSEKQAFALLPIPHRYNLKVEEKKAREEAIVELREEAKKIYIDRTNPSRKVLKKGGKEAQKIIEAQKRVIDILRANYKNYTDHSQLLLENLLKELGVTDEAALDLGKKIDEVKKKIEEKNEGLKGIYQKLKKNQPELKEEDLLLNLRDPSEVRQEAKVTLLGC